MRYRVLQEIPANQFAACVDVAERFGVEPWEIWFHCMAFKLGYEKRRPEMKATA